MDIYTTCLQDNQTAAYAAQELKSYLERMLAKETGRLQIQLGLMAVQSEREDSFQIHFTRTEGLLLGSNPRSILLGVYNYLHYLGCRFVSYVKEKEVVPQISADVLTADYEKTASFFHRCVCIEGANAEENILDFIEWMPKVGFSGFFSQFKHPYTFLTRYYHHKNNFFREPEPYTMDDVLRFEKKLEDAMKLRGLLLHKVGHGWTGEVLGVETDGAWEQTDRALSEERKPLAALYRGKREFFQGVPTNTNLCLSNPETIRIFADCVTAYAKNNPTVDYLHIWLADSFNNVCECEECVKTTLSDQYVELLNEIDRRLTEAGLATKIVFLLYQELLWPPIREKLLHEERFVLMFAPISRTFETSYDRSGKESEIPVYHRNHISLPVSVQDNVAYLTGWQKIYHGDSFVYDYPLGRAHYGDFGYLKISRVIHEDIRQLHSMGLNGYHSCQELRVSMPNMLPNYMMGYTLFDETTDAEALIEEYFAAAYPGDPALARTYLEKLSALGSSDYINSKCPRIQPWMAKQMEELEAWCEAYRDRLAQQEGGMWDVLAYHNEYVRRMAKALRHLASGENAQAAEAYRETGEFLSRGEETYQPYFDVYRVREVTGHCTGFYRLS